MLETDAPALAPQSVGGKDNTPAYLPEICATAAELLGRPLPVILGGEARRLLCALSFATPEKLACECLLKPPGAEARQRHQQQLVVRKGRPASAGREASEPHDLPLSLSSREKPRPPQALRGGLKRLAALVPHPRVNLTVYRGVLAGHHPWRASVVPRARASERVERAAMRI
jgi:hypothetical protein